MVIAAALLFYTDMILFLELKLNFEGRFERIISWHKRAQVETLRA